MNLSARTVFLTLAGVVPGLALALAAARVAPTATVSIAAPEPRAASSDNGGAGNLNRQAIGMSGCLAAACHGAPAGKALNGERGADCWQSSGSCWAAADPHAAAYSLLTDNPRRQLKVTAAKIMAKYAPGKKATEDARCLACHTNPALARDELIPDANARVLREQGVSCEACHGNAGAWLQPHTAWKGDRAKVYADTGMKPLYDLGERALACAGCHVGAPAENGLPVRDMNHDMIAAGHPRLNFDFAEYQRRLPQHWQEKDRTQSRYAPIVPNEAKVWFVGRVAHAEAACKLLEDRARRSREPNEHRTPWPEFAEFNCASCHHTLRVPESEKYGDWRKSAGYLGDRPPGVPPWQTIWPLTSAAGIASPKRDQSLLKTVVLAMETPRPAKADAAEGVAKTAAKLSGDLRRELVSLPGEQVEGRARAYFPGNALAVPEWDSATQLFFGLAALEYARGKPSDAAVKKYRSGVTAFRDQDWDRLESAFQAIREK
ncbi:hypothetical protein J8F10_19680 [Gemmata sp. G18]|uniref:Cytochrome c-552/4 domain-containing protein n=1 Tax=Gemmata palustris TaxID=2822762 RepID=A0ABS5BUS0_9BACT|nr:multiheme c-type cytochrome [Gemmata palustris]MBP3957474.1 hypothetical protein [Gemmata palustris]